MLRFLLVAFSAILVTTAWAAPAPVVYTQSNRSTASLPSPQLANAAVDQQDLLGDMNTRSDNLQWVNQLTELEDAVRELRGQLEEQQHALQQLQDGQRRLYVDLDSRIQQLTTHATTAALGSPASKPAAQANATAPASMITEEEADIVLKQQKMYEHAYQALRNKQYSQATAQMRQYLENYPNGEYAVNAHYWLGELSLLSGNPAQAKQEFNIVVKEYAQSPKAPDAMLKLAILSADQGQWKTAHQQLQSIQDNYPNTTAAQLAQQRIKQLNIQGH